MTPVTPALFVKGVPPFFEADNSIMVCIHGFKKGINSRIWDCESCSSQGGAQLSLIKLAIVVFVDTSEQVPELFLSLMHEFSKFLQYLSASGAVTMEIAREFADRQRISFHHYLYLRNRERLQSSYRHFSRLYAGHQVSAMSLPRDSASAQVLLTVVELLQSLFERLHIQRSIILCVQLLPQRQSPGIPLVRRLAVHRLSQLSCYLGFMA